MGLMKQVLLGTAALGGGAGLAQYQVAQRKYDRADPRDYGYQYKLRPPRDQELPYFAKMHQDAEKWANLGEQAARHEGMEGAAKGGALGAVLSGGVALIGEYFRRRQPPPPPPPPHFPPLYVPHGGGPHPQLRARFPTAAEAA